MENIKEVILSKKINGIADYFRLYNELNRETEKKQLQNKQKIRIALLSSFTIKGLKEVLFVKCSEAGIAPEFYVSDYTVVFEQMANKFFSEKISLEYYSIWNN